MTDESEAQAILAELTAYLERGTVLTPAETERVKVLAIRLVDLRPEPSVGLTQQKAETKAALARRKQPVQ